MKEEACNEDSSRFQEFHEKRDWHPEPCVLQSFRRSPNLLEEAERHRLEEEDEEA